MINYSFWNDRPVFVTGATGLVGGWLTKYLIEYNANVVCLIRDSVPQSMFYNEKMNKRVRVVKGDICDQTLLERILGEYEIDTVIHLAAQTIVTIANRNPISTLESNIKGTWSLLEACRRSPKIKQVVVASSDKAYGDQTLLPYTEETPLQGQHPYDVSKSCADLISQMYAKTYEVPVVITRCGNFYGGGDLNWNRIIPGTIKSILNRKTPVIRSDGQYIRDYFYVEDGVVAYLTLAEKLSENRNLIGQSFNFSNENQVSVKDLVEKISNLMNWYEYPTILNVVNNEIRDQHLNASKSKRILGWNPLFSLDQGLNKTIKWYERMAHDKKLD